MDMKRVVAMLCMLGLLAGCAAAPSAQSAPTPTPKPAQPALEKPTYTVERGSVVDELELSGHVGAIQQQDLSFAQDGFLKGLYVTRTGVITQGQLLAELDLGELPNQQRQAEVTYEQAQRELEQAQSRQVFAKRSAQLDLDEARSRLKALQEPAEATDITQARAAIQQAQAALDEARTTASATKTTAELDLRQRTEALIPLQSAYESAARDWQRLKDTDDPEKRQVYDAFTAAEAALRSAEAAVTQAQVAYDTARQNEAPAINRAEAALADAQAAYDALQKGPDAYALADAKRAVERAQLALEQADQTSDPELERRTATARLDVERVQEQIRARQLYAPFDGKIAAIDTSLGEAVAAYDPVISVMDASALEILVDNVISQDATKLGVGMPVQIVFSRYSGRTFTGTLTQLPASATSGRAGVNPDTAYHISYEAPDTELQVGDLANITVVLAQKDDTLWIAPQAVRSFEGRRFVVVAADGRQRRQDVKVGIVSDDRIEILEGLQAGDIVVGQ